MMIVERRRRAKWKETIEVESVIEIRLVQRRARVGKRLAFLTNVDLPEPEINGLIEWDMLFTFIYGRT
jgi:hypothetical protein